jgi:hypothetical protein
VHGSYAATFTEILGESGSLSGLEDESSCVYTIGDSGTNSDSFTDNGTDASGTFHVSEGSIGSFDNTTTGEQNTGDYTVTATNGDSYSYTETVNGSTPFTETESGTESGTSTLTQDGITGAYTKNASGTDLYTLAESGTLTGGGFSETVTGTDGYATNDVGNTGLQTDTSTTTGGGNWTRTSSGSGATLGSGSGTLVATGNAISGSFNETETGTDRYSLVEQFDNVANDVSGNTPGNVTFHSVGLPFRDPVFDILDVEKLKNALVEISGNKEEQSACWSIAAAIANTFNVNKKLISVGEQQSGYFCFEWAFAFEKAAKLEDKKELFIVTFECAVGPKEADGKSNLVHDWIKITSKTTGKSIYVDDGYVGNLGFVHKERPPIPDKYVAGNENAVAQLRANPGRDIRVVSPDPESDSDDRIRRITGHSKYYKW